MQHEVRDDRMVGWRGPVVSPTIGRTEGEDGGSMRLSTLILAVLVVGTVLGIARDEVGRVAVIVFFTGLSTSVAGGTPDGDHGPVPDRRGVRPGPDPGGPRRGASPRRSWSWPWSPPRCILGVMFGGGGAGAMGDPLNRPGPASPCPVEALAPRGTRAGRPRSALGAIRMIADASGPDVRRRRRRCAGACSERRWPWGSIGIGMVLAVERAGLASDARPGGRAPGRCGRVVRNVPRPASP